MDSHDSSTQIDNALSKLNIKDAVDTPYLTDNSVEKVRNNEPPLPSTTEGVVVVDDPDDSRQSSFLPRTSDGTHASPPTKDDTVSLHGESTIPHPSVTSRTVSPSRDTKGSQLTSNRDGEKFYGPSLTRPAPTPTTTFSSFPSPYDRSSIPSTYDNYDHPSRNPSSSSPYLPSSKYGNTASAHHRPHSSSASTAYRTPHGPPHHGGSTGSSRFALPMFWPIPPERQSLYRKAYNATHATASSSTDKASSSLSGMASSDDRDISAQKTSENKMNDDKEGIVKNAMKQDASGSHDVSEDEDGMTSRTSAVTTFSTDDSGSTNNEHRHSPLHAPISTKTGTRPSPSQDPSSHPTVPSAKPTAEVLKYLPETLDAEKTIVKYKTKVCVFWLQPKGCPYGNDCLFAHGSTELRDDIIGDTPKADPDSNPRFKTRICKWYMSSHGSHCPHGVRCTYAHGLNEIDQYLRVSQEKIGWNDPEREAIYLESVQRAAVLAQRAEYSRLHANYGNTNKHQYPAFFRAKGNRSNAVHPSSSSAPWYDNRVTDTGKSGSHPTTDRGYGSSSSSNFRDYDRSRDYYRSSPSVNNHASPSTASYPYPSSNPPRSTFPRENFPSTASNPYYDSRYPNGPPPVSSNNRDTYRINDDYRDGMHTTNSNGYSYRDPVPTPSSYPPSHHRDSYRPGVYPASSTSVAPGMYPSDYVPPSSSRPSYHPDHNHPHHHHYNYDDYDNRYPSESNHYEYSARGNHSNPSHSMNTIDPRTYPLSTSTYHGVRNTFPDPEHYPNDSVPRNGVGTSTRSSNGYPGYPSSASSFDNRPPLSSVVPSGINTSLFPSTARYPHENDSPQFRHSIGSVPHGLEIDTNVGLTNPLSFDDPLPNNSSTTNISSRSFSSTRTNPESLATTTYPAILTRNDSFTDNFLPATTKATSSTTVPSGNRHDTDTTVWNTNLKMDNLLTIPASSLTVGRQGSSSSSTVPNLASSLLFGLENILEPTSKNGSSTLSSMMMMNPVGGDVVPSSK